MMRVLAVFIYISIFSLDSQAHLLKVFAYTQVIDKQNISIQGKVYFAGGAGVANLSIDILDKTGANYSKVHSNAEGQFKLILPNSEYQIIANTLDGHIAKWQIKKPRQLGSTAPKSSATLPAKNPLNLDTALLESVIADQLQQQIQPLAEQINALQDKVRYQDAIGAIGYIFGVFGLLIWWRQKKSNG